MAGLTSRNETRTIYAVQALRAFAAAQVLAGHVLLDIQHRYGIDTFHLTRLPLLTGVDVFFCVSGFIMMLTSWDHFAETNYRETFLRHRIVRIVPMYYVFTTLMVAIVLVAPNALGATKSDPGQILSSYLFWPFERSDGVAQPVLSVGWTLNYEMFFYAIFSLCLAFKRGTAVLVMAGLFGGLASMNGFFRDGPTCLTFWTDPLILEFVAGAGVAYLYKSGVRVRGGMVVSLVAVLVALVVFYGREEAVAALGLHVPRLVLAGGPALLLLVSCTLLMSDRADRRVPAWLVSLGASSYALYLSHRFGMRLAAFLWSAVLAVTHLGTGFTYLYALLVFLICLAVGEVVHRALEKPMTAYILRTIRKPEDGWTSLVLHPFGKQAG